MDVIGWNFVMYNRSEQVRLPMSYVLGDGFWLTGQNSLNEENQIRQTKNFMYQRCKRVAFCHAHGVCARFGDSRIPLMNNPNPTSFCNCFLICAGIHRQDSANHT